MRAGAGVGPGRLPKSVRGVLWICGRALRAGPRPVGTCSSGHSFPSVLLYPGVKFSDGRMTDLNIRRDGFYGERNHISMGR